MKNLIFGIGWMLCCVVVPTADAQRVSIEQKDGRYTVSISSKKGSEIHAPNEGLWSIATGWQDDWPAQWHHASPISVQQSGDWQILTGTLELPEGTWHLRDAYRQEGDRIKCIRRYEWHGDQTLDSVTLAIRWQLPTVSAQAFLPGILYYGNPSGEKNGAEKVPVFHGLPGEVAIFEEHRFPMPFACMEWQHDGAHFGAAMHTMPSPAGGGHRVDQWWSLGVKRGESGQELVALSGPVTYNGRKSAAKAYQRTFMPYGNTWLTVKPGMVIEKTFYLELFDAPARGTAFQRPVHTSIDIFKPFYTGDLPTVRQIVQAKYKFAKSRWIEGENYAGFNMYPDFRPQQIELGWAGQSEAPAYALQLLADDLHDENAWKYAQKSMDHICTSPIEKNGFPVRYDVTKNKWDKPDPVSEGQAMKNIALAIIAGRNNKKVEEAQWEKFLEKACKIHATRLLADDWQPRNTAEAFYISPLLLAAKLFDNDTFAQAGLKAADYYAHRHLDMSEPYWGGTLDATCEDKEGAWGAFQGFLAAFEYTHDDQYLIWARHAGDVVLSYTVVWDIPMPPGRLADHLFKSRGWTAVSVQNQHLDVYGVLCAPAFYQLGELTGDSALMRLSKVMFRSCGQLIDPLGAQGEQIQQTNYTQWLGKHEHPDLRGGYSEDWTVFWITAHFLHAAADFKSMGVDF